MADRQSETKFFEAVRSFRKADEEARGAGRNIDIQAFQMVIIDLDAAVPGLEGANLGRALVLKAQCIYWMYRGELRKQAEKTRVYDVTQPSPVAPLFKEGLSCAIRGRKILEELGNIEELPWADDIVKTLRELAES